MGKIEFGDIDKYALSFAELSKMPDEIMDEIMQAAGGVIKKAQAEKARTMLDGPYNKGAVASAVTLGKVKRTKNGAQVYVTFEGTQHNNRIAEIAFVNEYGTKSQPARPFVQTANEEAGDVAVEAAAKILDDYMNKKGF